MMIADAHKLAIVFWSVAAVMLAAVIGPVIIAWWGSREDDKTELHWNDQ